jgi:NitT/TauT family transport system ATP-binding protein
VVFVTHDVDEALVLGDRIVVLGRYGVVSEHRVEHPRDPERPPGAQFRARVLQELSNTQSLAPVDERQAVA